jgi:hypothetical protein
MLGSDRVGFMVDKGELRQVYWEYSVLRASHSTDRSTLTGHHSGLVQ